METNTKTEQHSCVNWFKRNHRKYDQVTGNRIPVQMYMAQWLCVDCIDEIKLNKWFLPVKHDIDSRNIEQLQDWPGRIMPDGILWGTKVRGFNTDPVGFMEEVKDA